MNDHVEDYPLQDQETEYHLAGFPVPDCTAFVERQARRIEHAAHIAQLAFTRVEAFLGDLPNTLHRKQ